MVVIKKRITVIAWDKVASKFYENQIIDLFGELVVTSSYHVRDGSIKDIADADLYVVSTDAFDSMSDLQRYIPQGRPMVEIEVTYTRKAIEVLLELPEGTEALFVNLSEKMVREAITRLSQLGINHIKFTPCFPGCNPPSGFKLAVTPDECRYVPEDVEKIINLGQRVLASTTVVEIALRLRFDFLLEREQFRSYFRSIAANNYSFDQLFGRSLRLESQFEILLNIMDDGIIGVDENSYIFACNPKACDIAGITPESIVNQPAADAVPFIPFEECRKSRKKIENRLVRIKGVDINYSISPVIRGSEYMGSFATIQRFTEEETKQHNLRIQLLNKGHKAKYEFDDIIGNSEVIMRSKSIAEKMAKTNSSVLITGESGTGKELFAQAIHNSSARKEYPFIAINCAAMPDNLLESELFGYEDGAFTGARKGGKLGLFEFAHKGTIFLDEVEGMSPALQIKLLRVIQEGEVMRVGGNKIITVDVRIVAASNESLDELVASGTFRKDLYYRLNTLPVQLPPLRERGDDIMLLFHLFRKEFGGRFHLSPSAEKAFMTHSWNGNIRELRNYVEYLAYLDKKIIECEDLPQSFHSCISRPAKALSGTIGSYECELLMRIAGNRLDDYLFVLECLNEAYIKHETIGRNSIAEIADSNGIYLSQQEIRDILNKLDGLSLIKISKGRGGSKINSKGISVFNEMRTKY